MMQSCACVSCDMPARHNDSSDVTFKTFRIPSTYFRKYFRKYDKDISKTLSASADKAEVEVHVEGNARRSRAALSSWATYGRCK